MKRKEKWGILAVVMVLVLVFGIVSMVGATNDLMFTDGTLISNLLLGESGVEGEEGWLNMVWEEALPSNAVVGGTYTVGVTTTKDSAIGSIDDVLYIVEITIDALPAEENDFTAFADPFTLGYEGEGIFYWGPRSGFTFDSIEPITTTFEVTFHKKGAYDVKIYAVKLITPPV